LNVGNFESVRIDIGMERDLKPDESLKDAYWDVYREVSQQIQKRSKMAKKKMIGS
jgi:hypothetical protein